MKNKKNFSKPLVSIVILTCNSFNLVSSCIKNVVKLSAINYRKKIIIVDNGSYDKTVEKIYAKFSGIVVVSNRKNYGFSKGINAGIQLALDIGSDYIFLLNDDTIFPSSLMDNLISKAVKNNYLISGPLIVSADNKIWSLGGTIEPNRFSGGLNYYGKSPDELNNFSDFNVDFISGTAMLVKSEVFKKVGLLNEDYFLYYDDADFCFRAKKQNIDSVVIPTVKLIHLETTTIKKNSPSHYYHSAKSRLIFLFKYASFRKRLREIIRIPLSTTEILFSKDKVKRKYELLAYFDFFQHKVGQNTTIKPF